MVIGMDGAEPDTTMTEKLCEGLNTNILKSTNKDLDGAIPTVLPLLGIEAGGGINQLSYQLEHYLILAHILLCTRQSISLVSGRSNRSLLVATLVGR